MTCDEPLFDLFDLSARELDVIEQALMEKLFRVSGQKRRPVLRVLRKVQAVQSEPYAIASRRAELC